MKKLILTSLSACGASILSQGRISVHFFPRETVFLAVHLNSAGLNREQVQMLGSRGKGHHGLKQSMWRWVTIAVQKKLAFQLLLGMNQTKMLSEEIWNPTTCFDSCFYCHVNTS